MSEEKNIPPEEIAQKQPVNKEPVDETASSVEPIAKDEQKQTTTNQIQTEQDMEVHHHTHPAHGKKIWKDYFWEFLMLFLAVFCGFLAEYQLEHVIEHQKEKEFIQSLTDDLQDDEKALQTMLDIDRQGVLLLDSMIYFLNDASLAKQHGSQLYYMARIGPRSQPFANNSRTFDQLRNSGGFRLIRKTSASNKITGYYAQLSPIRLLEDNYNHEFDNYKRVAAKIFDPGILRSQETDEGEIMRSVDNPALITYDAELLKELGFHVLQMNGSRRSKRLMLENLKKSADDLRLFLLDQYHFNK